ncbi:GILT-like protein 1 [Neocloeon triangulifer]|uniref:GILT-like protein 1 n=1 Tax=Neocloeon triangulifer TaxID=2078957 RepID=UPI00286F02C6|nr:GILT-like protein 1 [Neocloeon triangulifer]XP_059469912.1 GILT-like protein 1 [Neocloeon triangulifer]
MNLRYKLVLAGVSCLIIWKLLGYSSRQTGPDLAVLEKEADKVSAVETSSSSSTAKEKVAIAVFYETLCPDSRGFFINQLLPTLERAPDIIDVTLVPYGKAVSMVDGNSYKFSCQHGPLECHGNRVHACATKYVLDQLTLVRYTTCMISDNVDPEDAGKRCARSLGIDWDPIVACSRKEEGIQLLAKMGEATHKLNPPVTFIPTIEVNKSLGYQASLLKRLLEELCTRFKVVPEPCKGISTVAFHRL